MPTLPLSCFEHLMLFFFLLPIPAASPVFIALFSAAIYISGKPCRDCMFYCIILFLGFSPLSPFATSPPDSQSPSNSTLTLPLDQARANRTWFGLNHGHLFDPALVGYDTPDTPPAASAVSTSEAQLGKLPKWYYDFRWMNMGVVVDIGLKRSEEGLKWEGKTGPEPSVDAVASEAGRSEGSVAGDLVEEGQREAQARDTGRANCLGCEFLGDW